MIQTPDMPFGHTRNQYLASLSAYFVYWGFRAVNLLVFGYGCGIGWFSPALPLLLSSDTPLSSGPLTTEQLSWSGSSVSLGAVMGSLLSGYCAIKLGTKLSLLILVIPQVLSWLLLIFGSTADYIIASRFFSGLVGGGAQTCTALYFAEIANDNIRGKLSTSYAISRNIGILLVYVLEIYINYVQMSMICVIICILFAICYYGLPSTPNYLLQIGADDDAWNAFKFYKGYANDDRNSNFQKAFERLQAISKESKESSKFSWKDISEPIACRGIIIGIVLTFLSQSCGAFVFITYASTIFTRSGANFSAEMSSIILALLQIAGTLMAAQFVETHGRKPLLLISLIGCKFGLSAMAAYLYCDTLGYDVSMFSWLPVTSLGFVIFISSVGIVPLSLICLVEALPTKVRSVGLTVGTISMSTSSFVIVALYPILLEKIDLHGYMTIFAVTCLLGILFVAFVVDETKGKTLDLLNEEKLATAQENP